MSRRSEHWISRKKYLTQVEKGFPIKSYDSNIKQWSLDELNFP